MDDQEAGRARELVTGSWCDPLGRLAGRLLGGLFVLVLVVTGSDPVLEDGVEIGLDVVVVRFVLVVLEVLAPLPARRRHGILVGLVGLLVAREGAVAFPVEVAVEVTVEVTVEIAVELLVQFLVELDAELVIEFHLVGFVAHVSSPRAAGSVPGHESGAS
ncbi:MAG: hypothetical protein KGR17_08190 [Acidobacteria bacterium]|nr:hypothetical protein [Acidobacteriota bacterium]